MRVLQMEDSNETESFDAYLGGEHYKKKLATFSELLGKSNSFTYQSEYERGKVSLPRNCRSIIYPIKLMKPNFIIDLMNSPGDLIPIGSPRSKLYCVKKITYSKTCCY